MKEHQVKNHVGEQQVRSNKANEKLHQSKATIGE